MSKGYNMQEIEKLKFNSLDPSYHLDIITVLNFSKLQRLPIIRFIILSNYFSCGYSKTQTSLITNINSPISSWSPLLKTKYPSSASNSPVPKILHNTACLYAIIKSTYYTNCSLGQHRKTQNNFFLFFIR